MVKLLHSEACSSIWFSLAGDVRIGDIAIPEGVVVLPVEKVAAQVSLAPGSELAGIRFQPAIGYGLICQHFGRPTVLNRDPRQLPGLIPLFSRLKTCCNNVSRVSTMQSWAENNFRLTRLIPGALQQALDCIRDDAEPGSLTQHLEISQHIWRGHFI